MKKKNKTSERRVAVLRAYQEVFKSPMGRKVLLDLMKNNWALETVFDLNPQKAAFFEGQRSVILRILATLKIDINEYMKNIEELNKPEAQSLWED